MPGPSRFSSVLAPRPRLVRARPASLVDVELDAAQEGAIAGPPGGSLLILGEAGHGKTTVAIHRLARLWRESVRGLRVAAVVPTDGLARLVQPLLRQLGVDVEVRTYDRWAALRARRAFRDLPRAETDAVRPSVQRLKRDPALRVALAALARRPAGIIDEDEDAPEVRTRASAVRGDLQHLFGDRELLEAVAHASRVISSADIDDVLSHTRVQFSQRAEQEHADVEDRKRLRAIDGRSIDDGTATSNAERVDVEDYAVLFELDRLRAQALGRAPRAPRAYDVVWLDEAQELAPLELALLGRSLAPGGTLIVAGDADQQTDSTAHFLGWPATLRELGRPDYDEVRLDIGYRCPPAVMATARAVMAGEPANAPTFAFDEDAALANDLAHAVRALARRDPRASVAVVCRSALTVRRLVERLRGDVPARAVFDGRFLPRGPVQVTTVDDVKGLEFDFVVIPDATARDYPDEPAARRAMYVAVTRARQAVAMAFVGGPSPLLASA